MLTIENLVALDIFLDFAILGGLCVLGAKIGCILDIIFHKYKDKTKS